MFEFNQAIPLWKGKKPFPDPVKDALVEEFLPYQDGTDRLQNISEPSITYFPATGPGPFPAVVVCPGGAYNMLAWNKEGRDICAMLNQAGFTAFLLKYRCPDRRAAARADLSRALRLLRFHAQEFRINPEKVGVIGFSAGAHLCAVVTAPADPVPYEAQDEIDKLSCRPDFTALIYPAYLVDSETFELAPEFKLDSSVPPCFLVQTEDDPVLVENSLTWYLHCKRAGVPCEMHLYPKGRHGYGVCRIGEAVEDWPLLACPWFRRQI